MWGGEVENSDYKILINDKVLFHEYAATFGIPVPEMVAVYKNNRWFVKNDEVEDVTIDQLLQNLGEDRLFLKLASEGAARGVFVMKRINGRLDC